jgi:hypothetical protein
LLAVSLRTEACIFAFGGDVHGKNISLTRPIVTGYKLPVIYWEFINHRAGSRQQKYLAKQYGKRRRLEPRRRDAKFCVSTMIYAQFDGDRRAVVPSTFGQTDDKSVRI